MNLRKFEGAEICDKLNFLIPIALQPVDVNLWYFKPRRFGLTYITRR